MNKTTFYPLDDYPKAQDAIKLIGEEKFHLMNIDERMKLKLKFRALWIGEKRCPKKGEWYLSGVIIKAYKAPNDLTTPYHIARLVLTETKTIVETKIIAE